MDNSNPPTEPAATQSALPADLEYAAIEQTTRTALREVYDPELGMSVVELGLIRKFAWTPDTVEVTMILTTPFCPYGPAMLEQTRIKVMSATDGPAKIEMGMEIWDPSMMEEGAGADWGLF